MDDEWQQKVRERAYAIWKREGQPEGGTERHWAQAEEELRAEGADATVPGDEAPPGTPGTGENVCPVCNGTGRAEGKSCPNCAGTGKVIEGIGGA